ncbi:hypothetical protein MPER_08394, partial [Moniliophthora perniciosa FA553]
ALNILDPPDSIPEWCRPHSFEKEEGSRLATVVGPQFDMVGFDPRGISRSAPGVPFYETCAERAPSNTLRVREGNSSSDGAVRPNSIFLTVCRMQALLFLVHDFDHFSSSLEDIEMYYVELLEVAEWSSFWAGFKIICSGTRMLPTL